MTGGEFELLIRRQQKLRRQMQAGTGHRQGLAVEAMCQAYRAVHEGAPRLVVVVAEFRQQAQEFTNLFASALAKVDGEPVHCWQADRHGPHWQWVAKHPRAVLVFHRLEHLLPDPVFQGAVVRSNDDEDEIWGNRAATISQQWRNGIYKNPPGKRRPVDYSRAWQVFVTQKGWSSGLAQSIKTCETMQGQKEAILQQCAGFINDGDPPFGFGCPASRSEVREAFFRHLEKGTMVLMNPARASDFLELTEHWLNRQAAEGKQVDFRGNATRFFLPLSLINNPSLDPKRLKMRVTETVSELRSRAQEQAGIRKGGTLIIRAGTGRGTAGAWLKQQQLEQPVRVLIFSPTNALEEALSQSNFKVNLTFRSVQNLEDLARFEPDLAIIDWDADASIDPAPAEIIQGLRQEQPGLPVFLVGDSAHRKAMKTQVAIGAACDAIVTAKNDSAGKGRPWALFRRQLHELCLDKCLRRLSIQQAAIGFPRQRLKRMPGGGVVATLQAPQTRRIPGKAAHHVEAQVKERMANVWGLDHAKTRLMQACHLLINPSRLIRQTTQPPSGFLLIGPTGSGKTLLARALAGETQLPILQTTASDLMRRPEPHGHPRKNDEKPQLIHPIQTLFTAAREMAPSLVFIDEIHPLILDHGPHGEKLLACMDGFEKSERHILVIGATNLGWIREYSNEAFWRPGRLEETLRMDLPDHHARRKFIQAQFPKLFPNGKSGQHADALDDLVRRTARWSPAKLQRLFRESSLRASCRSSGRPSVTVEDMRDACTYLKYPNGKPTDLIRPEDRVLTAWHEAGHALAHTLLFPWLPIDYLTIEPRENALGFMAPIRDESLHCLSKLEIQHRIQVALAGRQAELLAPHGQSNPDAVMNSGAASDLRTATYLARHAVLELGMDEEYGPVVYSYGRDTYERLPDKVHGLIKAWVQDSAEAVTHLLENHFKKLRNLANQLLSKNALHHAEVILIIGK